MLQATLKSCRMGPSVVRPCRETGGDAMKIARIDDLHCDAGWRTFSFLKITTDDGLVGWSEYTEADGSRGLTSVIHGMAEALIGTDPRPVQAIDSLLYAKQ